MAAIVDLIILWLQFILVDMYSFSHQKPVTEVEWRGRCTLHKLALNDCNWCRCNKKHEYVCEARSCGLVDMFGHFNDAIRELNVGMEGKGSWRATELACEPGVQYRRTGLLCVCTDEGTWPSPVCRDIFRVLHSIEITGDKEVANQRCSPTKLYLIGCEVCLCPSTGRLNPKMCTTKNCSEEDPIIKAQRMEEQLELREEPNQEPVVEELQFLDEEIYAECDPDTRYKMGCKTCDCLTNNRLHCTNCTLNREEKVKTFCGHLQPGHTFKMGCNLCYCDEKNLAYCSSKKCLLRQTKTLSHEVAELKSSALSVESKLPFDENSCVPGVSYSDSCNTCYCDFKNGEKVFVCTKKTCARSTDPHQLIHFDCVKGTSYELNCLICQCGDVDGIKMQLCWQNPECTSKKALTEPRSLDLDSLHGYCEPLHVYKRGCNTCQCLSDGKTVKCTSYTCKQPQDPISVEIVPVAQEGAACPNGLSYKIECNYCFCLSNGNAICTTNDCRGKRKA